MLIYPMNPIRLYLEKTGIFDIFFPIFVFVLNTYFVWLLVLTFVTERDLPFFACLLVCDIITHPIGGA